MGETNSSINNTLRLTLKNLNTSTNSIITSNDRVIDAFGKLQAQISNISSSGSSVSISNGNNFTIYNTTDQVTNYERFSSYWSGNTFYLSNQYNGSGQKRPIFLNVNTAGLVVNDTASVGGGIRVISNPQTANTSIFGVLGVLNGSNTTQDGATIAPYFNQSGTAIGNALKVSPFISTVGSGINLLNLGTNTAADNTGTHTSRFVVSSDGKVGFGTDSPTHTITLPSGASWISYNTTDQTTNFSRVGGKWSADTYEIITERGGSNNTDTHIAIGTAISGINRLTIRANSTPSIFTFNSGSFGGAGFATMTTALGAGSPILQNVLSLYPTISQSGTAGYRGIFISPFEQTTGSGSKLLLDLGTNSAANGGGTHTSRFSVASNGEVNFGTLGRMFSNGNFFIGSSPVDAGYKLDINGIVRTQKLDIAENTNSWLKLGQFSTGYQFGIVEASSSGSGLAFRTNGFDRLIISNNGTINQGANTPLFVQNESVGGGSAKWETGNGYSTFGTLVSTPLVFITNNSERFRIHGDGNIGIGATANAGYKLDVNGTARVSGNLTVTNIEATTDGMGDVGILGKAFNRMMTKEVHTELIRERYNGAGLALRLNSNISVLYMFPATGNFHFQNGGTYTDIPSARVAINSTTQGVLFPRMTTTQRDAISSPAEGLIIYNTTTKKLNIFTTIWEQITSA